MAVLVFVGSLAGCSVEEIQGWFEDNANNSVENVILGILNNEDADSRDNNSPYGNNRDFILHDFNLNEVGESRLTELPEYDFSGPPATGPAATTDSGLLAENTDGGPESSEEEAGSTKTVFLAPLYSGLDNDGVLRIRSNSQYGKYLKWDPSRTQYINYCANNSGDGFGQSCFKGYHETYDNTTYYEWQLACQLCKATGKYLKKKGYNVVYADEAIEGKLTDSPANYYRNVDVMRDWHQIATNARMSKADYVLIIGFHENGFRGLTNSTNTRFLAQSKLKFMKKVKKEFSASKNIKDCIGQIHAVENSDTTVCSNVTKRAQTALMSLKIANYTGDSSVILFGSFKENVSSKDPEYSYKKPNSLGEQLANAIDKAFRQ